MAKTIGRKISLGIAKEAVRGTAENSATFWIPLTSKSFDDVIEQVLDESSIGIIEATKDAKIVKKSAEGSLEGNIGDASFGLLALSLFGSVSSSLKSGETAVYEHSYSIAESVQHQSLTYFVDDGGLVQDYKYPLGMIASLEIGTEPGKFVTFKANIKSKAGESASLTPSFTAENNFLGRHATFKIASNLAGLDAAPTISVKKISLKFNPNLEEDAVLGSLAPVDILNKAFFVEGEVELTFEDETFKSALLGDTAKAMRIDFKNTDVTIGNSSNPELKIDFAKVKFSEVARKMDNNGIVTQTVKFGAHYSMADAKLLDCVLTNTVSSY